MRDRILVQRVSDGERFNSIMTDGEFIEYFSMRDCHGEQCAVFDISEFGEVIPLTYVGWQPNGLIQFVDGEGNVIISRYGHDH